jgi:hypothetical protein
MHVIRVYIPCSWLDFHRSVLISSLDYIFRSNTVRKRCVSTIFDVYIHYQLDFLSCPHDFALMVIYIRFNFETIIQ